MKVENLSIIIIMLENITILKVSYFVGEKGLLLWICKYCDNKGTASDGREWLRLPCRQLCDLTR